MNNKIFLLLLLVLMLVIGPLYSADIKISDMPSATSVFGADIVPIVQSGSNKKASFTTQKALWDTYYQPLGSYVSTSRTLTIGGVAQDLSTNRSWTTATILEGLGSPVQGDIMYRGATQWVLLTPGTDGDVLTTHGASANPTWETPSGGGGGGSVDDTPFGSAWNGVTGTAPSENAVYDEIHSFDSDDDGKVNVLDQAAGIANTNSGGVLQTPITDNSSNWNTAFTDRLKWDGGSTGLTASTGRTSLGATTVGSNIFTLTNPSSVTFLRINADNTASARSALNFRTDIGLAIGTDVEAWDADLDTWATLTPSANFQTLVPHTFSQMRTDLGLAIGTNVEAWDADLDALAAISGVQGDIIYRNATGWTRLGAGTDGQVLTTHGASANPTFADVSATAGVSDTAFASSWNGVTGTAPSKNAVYDEIHAFDTDDDGKVNVLDMAAGIVKTDSAGVVSAAIADTDYTANAFKTVSVSGQSDVVADSASDTLTLAAGSNVTITTNAGTDTVTIASSGGGSSYWDSSVQVSGSNFTTTSSTAVDITGLTFSASASSLYEIDCVLRVQNSATSAENFGVAYSAAGATGSFVVEGPASTSTSISDQTTVLGTASTAGYVLFSATDAVILIHGIVVTGVNTGNITAQVKIASGNTATIYIGSIMNIKKLH